MEIIEKVIVRVRDQEIKAALQKQQQYVLFKKILKSIPFYAGEEKKRSHAFLFSRQEYILCFQVCFHKKDNERE